MYPIFIPMNSTSRVCPHCGKHENKVDVCVHCDYHYPSEPISGVVIAWLWLAVVVAIVCFVWFPFMTIGEVNLFGRFISAAIGGIGTTLVGVALMALLALGAVTIERLHGPHN